MKRSVLKVNLYRLLEKIYSLAVLVEDLLLSSYYINVTAELSSLLLDILKSDLLTFELEDDLAELLSRCLLSSSLLSSGLLSSSLLSRSSLLSGSSLLCRSLLSSGLLSSRSSLLCRSLLSSGLLSSGSSLLSSSRSSSLYFRLSSRSSNRCLSFNFLLICNHN